MAVRGRHQQQVNAQLVKKRSRYTKAPGSTDGLTHEATTKGYSREIYRGSGFETFVLCLVPGSTTGVVQHPTKTKVVRVLSGSLCVSAKNILGVVTHDTQNFLAGSEFTADAGVAYGLGNNSNKPVEFLVIQDAKYEARQVVLEPGVQGPEYVADDEESTFVPPPRSGLSKAVLQMQEQTNTRGTFTQTQRTPVIPRGTAAGANAKPLDLGSLSMDDAG